MPITIEVTKAPRGKLSHGAQMTGTIQITNAEKKEKTVTEVYVDLHEMWNDENLSFKPKEITYSFGLGIVETYKKTVFHMHPGESRQSYLSRVNQACQIGKICHCGVHEHQMLFQSKKGDSESVLKPNETKKWQFTVALPKQWLCDKRTDNWRFEIEGCVNGEVFVGPLTVPVEGS